MDWNILPLQIILACQAIAIIGVSLMLIYGSYRDRSEIADHKPRQPRS
jgi:hypothetical protein